jgi:hypothetical protein
LLILGQMPGRYRIKTEEQLLKRKVDFEIDDIH